MEDDDAHIFGHHLEWASDFRVSQNPSLCAPVIDWIMDQFREKHLYFQ